MGSGEQNRNDCSGRRDAETKEKHMGWGGGLLTQGDGGKARGPQDRNKQEET